MCTINPNKLTEFSKNKWFTDVELVLKDDHEIITLSCHRVILCASIPYFDKLFSQQNAFKESNQNIVEIIVPNAVITKNIILQIYGQNHHLHAWPYQLELLQCSNFLNCKFDYDFFRQLQVPKEYYNQLLDLIDSIGYTSDNIKLLVCNLPLDYDISGFPKDLLESMLIETQTYYLYSVDENGLIIKWNLETGDIISKYKTDYRQISCISKLPDNTIAICDKSNINIFNPVSNNHIKTIQSQCYFINTVDVVQMTNSTLIAVAGGPNNDGRYNINIIDVEFSSIIQTLSGHSDTINIIKFSPDSQKLLSSGDDGLILLWDVQTGQKIVELNNYYCIHSAGFFSNKELIVGDSEGKICIIDLDCPDLEDLHDTRNTVFYIGTFVSEICVIPEKALFLTPNNDSISIFSTYGMVQNLNLEIRSINHIIYFDINNSIIISDGDNYIKIFDFESKKLIHNLECHTKKIIGIVCSSNYTDYIRNKILTSLHQF